MSTGFSIKSRNVSKIFEMCVVRHSFPRACRGPAPLWILFPQLCSHNL
jgi:hypothetical protein